MEKTADRLATMLTDLGLVEMATAARAGRYDDFASESATPIVDLVTDLESAAGAAAGATRLAILAVADKARMGAFDSTAEEAEAWAASQTDPEMREAIVEVKKARPKWPR